MRLIENAGLKNMNPGAARALLKYLEGIKRQMQAKKLNDIRNNCLRQQLSEKISDLETENEIDMLKQRKAASDDAARRRKSHFSNFFEPGRD